MRTYLELYEITEDKPEFIRADVTDLADYSEVQLAIEDIMAGAHYRLVKHNCYHDSGGHCITEILKEV